MHFTPWRSKVSPAPAPNTAGVRVPCPSPAPPQPCWPLWVPGALHPALHWHPPLERPGGHQDATWPAPAQHIPTFYLKIEDAVDSALPPFLWRTLPYALLQMMNTVYRVCFKQVSVHCSLFLSCHSPPHACFQFRVLGGNDEHMKFFSLQPSSFLSDRAFQPRPDSGPDTRALPSPRPPCVQCILYNRQLCLLHV